MLWTLPAVKEKLIEIKDRGFIPIPEDMFRTDDGIVGQIIEREFNVEENNLSVGDLGEFELKGMRAHSNTLTLCHKTTTRGMTPNQIFDRFGYVRASLRNPSVMKKKLFMTITGDRLNKRGFILKSKNTNEIDLYHETEFIAGWNIEEQLEKIEKVILVIADTQGKANSLEEKFHYKEAFLMSGLNPINHLVNDAVIKIDLCIDKVVGDERQPHDRGPHIRVSKANLKKAYTTMAKIL